MPSACGYDAARSVATMHRSNDDWQTWDVSDAAHARWVRRGNGFLTDAWLMPHHQQPAVHSDMNRGAMLTPLHVQALVNAFARSDAGLEVTGQMDAFTNA